MLEAPLKTKNRKNKNPSQIRRLQLQNPLLRTRKLARRRKNEQSDHLQAHFKQIPSETYSICVCLWFDIQLFNFTSLTVE